MAFYGKPGTLQPMILKVYYQGEISHLSNFGKMRPILMVYLQ